jgi:DNA-binding LacI/PurR family transcriptional regulator
MATLKEIASRAGVSVYTVSKVLSDQTESARISAARAEAVRRIAQEMNFRPNGVARAMRQGRTLQVGVLVPNNPGNRFAHPLAYETILGINEGLQQAGYLVALARIDDVRRGLEEQSRMFKERVLDGMIVLDSMPADVEQRLEEIIPKCVWCDSNMWREHGCIRRDEEQAGRLAGEAAVSLGYRQIAMVTYSPEYRSHFSASERLAGVRAMVEPLGRPLEILIEPGVADMPRRRQLAEQLHPELIVICHSIYQAQALRSMGEEVEKIAGRDYGLICCDDMHQLDRLWPGLSRVTFDRYGMGLEAARMMLKMIASEKTACVSRRLGGELLLGTTTRARDGSGTGRNGAAAAPAGE